MNYDQEVESYQSESKWAPVAFTIFLVVATALLIAGWFVI